MSYEEYVVKWMRETQALGDKIAAKVRELNWEFRKALIREIHNNPVDKAILFLSLTDQGFFMNIFGYQPILTEDDVMGV